MAFVAPLVFVLVSFVGPGVARAAEMFDQSQTSTSGGGVVIDGPDSANPESQAQTFTAGVTGRLDRVDLYLQNDLSSATAPLRVEIRNTVGGAPGSTVLASASVPAATIGADGGWVKVDFASPASVKGGTQYAIVAYTHDTGIESDYRWYISSSNPYAAGDVWSSSSSPPTTWAEFPSEDLAFRTYVSVPAADSIYWGNYNGNTIGFANLDGGGHGGLLNTSPVTPNGPDGEAIDLAAGRIYWASFGGGTKISFARLTGGGGHNFTATAASFSGPAGPVVDAANGRMYWANYSNNTIEYAQLNGSAGGQLNTAGAVVNQPQSVAVDTANARIYWDNLGNDTIYSAKLNNTGAGQQLKLGTATVNFPNGIAIDVRTGTLYWANESDNAHPIAWAKTDNSGTAGNLDTSGATANGAAGIAIDPSTGKLYWANYNVNTISFAKLAGGDGGQLGTAGTTPDGPIYPLLVKAPSATAAPKISGGSTVGAKLSCSNGKWGSDLIGAFLYRRPTSFGYSWRRNGKLIAGATKRSTTASRKGTYTCTVTGENEAGSTKTTSTTRSVR